MATSGGDARVKELNRIWGEWGLEPDVTLAKAQQEALGVVAGWLDMGNDDPEIVIRATQILLLDPERTDRKSRPCWRALQDELLETWSNAGSGGDHLLYAHALLLATWPIGTWQSLQPLPALMDSSWSAMRGRSQQVNEITTWRRAACATGTATATSLAAPPAIDIIPSYTPQGLPSDNAINIVANNRGHEIGTAFREAKTSISRLEGSLSTTVTNTNKNLTLIGQFLEFIAANVHRGDCNEIGLLWWGQARYCKAESKPYRRLPHPQDVLWWAAREAAELSSALEVEPAASYVVETLTSLGHDPFEKKPLRQWMADLHATLDRARDKAPPISERLETIASVDALGLPVTWVRLKAANKDSLDGADAAIALALDAEIDRGEWASWIFRETLLDLRLSEGA